VVRYCHISLNSQQATLKELAAAANSLDKVHGVILMVDLGDLREGVFHSDTEGLHGLAEYVLAADGLELKGIGANLTCYGSVLPTTDNLGRLVEIAREIRAKFGCDLPIVSGGNSSTLYMLADGQIPAGINNLRLGESIVCGKETAFGETFPGLVADVAVLDAEIIEIAVKPSMPEGKININAFGETIAYVDKGLHTRAIVAVGRQDVYYEGLACLYPGVEIIGASSDHLIVDITAAQGLTVGSRLTFSLSYGAVLAAFTSKYVDKTYV
jgi:predicted amino acid racemase